MDTWRKNAVGMLVLGLIIWVVFIVGWWEVASSASHHLSDTDWRGNHQTKTRLALAAFAVFGLPPLGAVLGWMLGPRCGGGQARRPASRTAAGFLFGALGLVVIAVVGYLVAVYRTAESFSF